MIHTHWDTSPHNGYIFVEYGGIFFPEFEWFDIPSSVLCMWTNSIYEFIIHEFQNPCCLYFMDGPYKMELSFNADLKCILSLYCREKIIECVEIDFTSFVAVLIEQAQALRDFYLKNPSIHSSHEHLEIENNIARLLTVRGVKKRQKTEEGLP